MGVVAHQQDQHQTAVSLIRRALQLKSQNAEALYNLSNALSGQRQLDDGIATYHHTLQLQPNYAEAHNNLGIALNSKGRSDDAIASCLRAL